MTCIWLVLGKNRGPRPFFKMFRYSNDNAKSVFLVVNASLRWLNNISGVFPCLYCSAGFGNFLQVSALASPWLKGCLNCTPTPEENDKYSANHS